MSDIAPNSIIFLYKGVPLTPDYEHTLYSSSKATQLEKFGLSSGGNPQVTPTFSLQNNTYQRVNKGVIRVGLPYSDVYECNYMVFTNSLNFEGKTYYAFITKVNYINNITSEIEYKLDVIQTWLISNNISLGDCYVLREHTTDDSIGANIEPEPITIGDYVYNDYHQMFSTTRIDFILGYAYATTDQNSGGIYDSIYSGSKLLYFKALSDVTPGTSVATDYEINRKINQLLNANYPANITNLYCVPGEFMESGVSQGEEITKSYNLRTKSYPLTGVGSTVNGYTPKNKKLFTYPYNFLHIDNGCGDELNVRYEYFDLAAYPGASITNLQPVFYCYCSILQPVSVVGYFIGYNGTLDTSNLSESLILTNYPMCSFTLDSYAAWAAQNSIGRGYNMLTKIVLPIGKSLTNAAKSGTVGGAVGAGVDSIGTVVNYMNTEYQASRAIDTVKGNINNGNVNAVNRKQSFYYGRMSIRRERAMVIDDFFTKYGYATNRLKTPNISARPHWNYVKCLDPNILQTAPADDLVEIVNILTNGITFWHKLNEIGDYSLDNRII